MLAEALIEFEENAYCPGCGQLKSKAWDEDTAGSWQHSTVQCYACADHAALEKGSTEAEPGVLRFMTLNEADMRRARARKNAKPVDLDAL